MTWNRIRRYGPWTAAVLLALAVAWGLARYGGTETPSLYRLFLLAAVPTALALLLRPPRLDSAGELLLAAAGLFLLLQAALRPTLAATGYLHWSLGWMAVVVSFSVARGVPQTGSMRPAAVSRPVRLLVFALVGLGAIQAVYGLGQVIGLGGLEAGTGGHLEGMATGSFVNRNHYAGFLNLVLPLAVGALYAGYARRWGRRSRTEMLGLAWTALLASAFIGVAVLLSRSRGGTVTLVLTVAFMGVLLALGRRTSRRGLSSVASATLAGLILLLGLAVGLDALLARFAEIDQTQTRLAIYQDTVDLIADEPIGGTGPGLYRWRFRPYQTANLEKRYFHAHNDYLEIIAEWGIPLGLAFWAFVALRLRGAVLVALSSKDPWRRGLALGLAGSIVSILIHSLFDFNLQIPSNLMVFGIVLGMAGATGAGPPHGRDRSTASPSRSLSPDSRRSGSWGTGFFGAGAWRDGWGRYLLAAVLLLALLLAASRILPRLEAEERTRGSVELTDLSAAAAVDPTNPEAHFLLAIAHRDHPQYRDLGVARRHLERATDLNPWAWRYWLELSRVEELAGRVEAAAAALGTAVELNPRRGDYRWRLANFHLRHGATDEAFSELGTAVRLDPTLGRAAFHLLLKAGAGWEEIERLWPEGPAARLALLELACRRPLPAGVAEPSLALLDQLWRQALADPDPAPPDPLPPDPLPTDPLPTDPLPVERAGFYVSHLLDRGAYEAARDAWIALTERSGLEDATYADERNLVWNGSFELPVEPSRRLGPLDWRLSRGDGFRSARERLAEPVGDSASALRIDFSGENVEFRHLSQQVVVPAGRSLRLTARMRTEGLTSQSGLFLELVSEGRVLGATEPVIGTRPWSEVEAIVEVPLPDIPSSESPISDSPIADSAAPAGAERDDSGSGPLTIVEVRLRRRRSHRIAGRIEGTVWLDEVRLTPLRSVVSARVAPGAARFDLATVDPATVDAGMGASAGARWAGLLAFVVRATLAQPRMPPGGRLEIVSQPGVAVSWDGVEVGRTDAEGRLVIDGIPPGTYAVGLAKEGFRTAAQRVSVEPGENRIESFLTPRADRAASGVAPSPGPDEPAEVVALQPDSTSTESPPIESPPIESPPIESPPIESPPIESPPTESPPIESPPTEPVSIRPEDTEGAAAEVAPSAPAADGSEPTDGSGRFPVLVVLIALLATAYLAVRVRLVRSGASDAARDGGSSKRTPSFLSDLRRRERALERQARQRRVIDAEASEPEVGIESEDDSVSSSDPAVGDGEGTDEGEESAER